MKNDKIISLWNMLDPDEEGKSIIMDKIKNKQKKSRPVFRMKIAAAVAAVICLAVVGGLLAAPNGENIFSVKAYALGETEEGAIGLREIDLLDQPDVWGSYSDGENFFVSVGLRYEGKNIKSVEFSTAEGFFAKQYIDKLSDGKGITKMYVGADNRLVMYGDEFEIAGDTITLNEDTMTDDLLLFWGTDADFMSSIPTRSGLPEIIEITAKAVFKNGKTQEVPVTIDLSGIGMGGGKVSSDDEEWQRLERQHEYYSTLPIAQCELIPESVKTVNDVYEYGDDTGTTYFRISEELEFDDDGFFRCGFSVINGKMTISAIKRDSDGTLTGMLYRVPESLIYKE